MRKPKYYKVNWISFVKDDTLIYYEYGFKIHNWSLTQSSVFRLVVVKTIIRLFIIIGDMIIILTLSWLSWNMLLIEMKMNAFILSLKYIKIEGYSDADALNYEDNVWKFM